MYRGFDFTGYSAPYVGGISDSFREDVSNLKQEFAVNRDRDAQLKIETAKLRLLEGDAYVKNSVLEEYDQGIKALAQETVSGRIPYEMAGTLVSQGAAKILGNETLLKAVESKANWDAAQKMKLELGPLALDFKNVNPAEWNTEKQGVYTPGVEQEMNWRAAIKDIFKVLPSSYKIDLTTLTETEIADALSGKSRVVSSFAGVTDSMIRKAVNDRLNVYFESPEGQQRFRKLTLIDKMDEKEAREVMKKEAIMLASDQKISQTDYASSEDIIKANAGRLSGAQERESSFIGTPKNAVIIPDSTDLVMQNGKEGINKGDKSLIKYSGTTLANKLSAYKSGDKAKDAAAAKILADYNKIKEINPDLADIILIQAADANLVTIGSGFLDYGKIGSTLAALNYSPKDVSEFLDKLEESGLGENIHSTTQISLTRYKGVSSFKGFIERLHNTSDAFTSKPTSTEGYSVFKDLKNDGTSELIGQGVTFYGIDPTKAKPELRTALKESLSNSATTYESGFDVISLPAGVTKDDLNLKAKIDGDYVAISDRPVDGKGHLIEARVPLTKKKNAEDDDVEFETVYLRPKQGSLDGNAIVNILGKYLIPGFENNPALMAIRESVAMNTSSMGGSANTINYSEGNAVMPLLQPYVEVNVTDEKTGNIEKVVAPVPLTTGDFTYKPDGEMGYALFDADNTPTNVRSLISNYYSDPKVRENIIKKGKNVKNIIGQKLTEYAIQNKLLSPPSYYESIGQEEQFIVDRDKIFIQLFAKKHVDNISMFATLLSQY
jgi:hypothetical protein